MFYKNTSYSAKTFYGVVFQPGEIKEVPGYINNNFMLVVNKPVTENKTIQQKPSPEEKKESVSVEPTVEAIAEVDVAIESTEEAEEVKDSVKESKPPKNADKKEHK